MLHIEIQSHKPLRELVYEELRNHIITGDLKPGSRIMEVELADDMGVSRTPVREAIRQLEKEGLLVIEPRKGIYVTGISTKDMEDVLEVRENLEGLAAYLAAQRITDEEKEMFREAKEGFKQAVACGNVGEMIEYDAKFHRIMVDASKNNHLVQMVELLQELVLRFRFIYYKDYKRGADMVLAHDRIYDEIVAGNGANARFEAFNHIEKLRDVVVTTDFGREP